MRNSARFRKWDCSNPIDFEASCKEKITAHDLLPDLLVRSSIKDDYHTALDNKHDKPYKAFTSVFRPVKSSELREMPEGCISDEEKTH
ncbi:hypothetical protein TNCV_2908981 [Trichonephila clavipes]|nr:hypothetical protein TNCV_2908981 [Trichonephila clavipes]